MILQGTKLQDKIDKVMSILPNRIDMKAIDPKVGWTKEPYIKHTSSLVEEAQSNFIKLCDSELGGFTKYINGSHRQGIIGRILDDSNSELYKTWNRFMCIDELYREWEQPYFAINFEKFNDDNSICVNNYYPEVISFYRDKKINEIVNV